MGLSNLLSIAVLAGVYGTVFKVANFKDYSIYLGLGLVVWNYISSSVLGSAAIFRISAGLFHGTDFLTSAIAFEIIASILLLISANKIKSEA